MTYAEAKRIILEGIAKITEKEVETMKPWEDYDPISVDEEAHHLARGSSGVRWTGD